MRSGEVADPASVDQVAAALLDGGVVLLPTDTVYGLAALPADRQAMQRLFALKGRGADVPIAVLCASADQALALTDGRMTPAVEAVAARWWPGPLTLVLGRREALELHLGEPSTTIGVRVPHHPLVRAVAAQVGPIAATSANPHGLPTPETAAGAAAALGDGIALVVDGGRLAVRASTVIDATSAPWRVLREGPVAAADVLAVAEASTGGAG
jgi:tRNA threonylcarbamoyl adenosine modification protein (Sua5/YciO/YrdC/YwlC family)